MKGRAYQAKLASMAPIDRHAKLYRECNLHPSHELIRLGYRTGMPPIAYCRVVHPHTGELRKQWEQALPRLLSGSRPGGNGSG